MNRNSLFAVVFAIGCMTTSLYAPLNPGELLAAISNAQIDEAAKKAIAVGWVNTNPGELNKATTKAALKKIFGGANLDEGLAKAKEAAEAAKKSGTGAPGAEMGLAPAVKTAIDAVSKAADKKTAAKTALQTIGKETGKPLAAASGLSADEITTALKAGMAS